MTAELWAVKCNDSTVCKILDAGGTLEQCVIALADQKQKLVQRINALEAIAPKKIRLADGKMLIYHCPDELIP